MGLSIAGTKTALAVNLTASYLASGGTAPYTYSVRPGGAGGTIDAATGIYTAPALVPPQAAQVFDTIQVRDNVGALATTKIMVATPLMLFCEIVQRQLGLADGRVWLWDQKVFQPTDAGLYIAVSVPSCKPFSSRVYPGPTGWDTEIQTLNMQATVDLDIISRSTEALNRKEEVLLALNSLYSEAQQEANSFSISRLTPGARFVNLSFVDGAAIPYRFRISVNMQYAVTKVNTPNYFDTFDGPSTIFDS